MVDNKQQWKAWLYLSPAIVLLLVFTVWPIINTVRLAFLEGYDTAVELGWFNYGQHRGDPYPFSVGFGNFLRVVQNAEFGKIIKNNYLPLIANGL